MQARAPGALQLPSAQHTTAPLAEKVAAAQGVQAAALAALYVLAAHGEHELETVLPAKALYLPASQLTQAAAPALLQVPLGQVTHAATLLAPGVALAVPATH